MNRTEAALGVSITLLSLLAMFAIWTGVGTSAIMPGRYAWEGATRAYYFMAFLPVLGFAVIVHGTRISKSSELILGLVIILWSFFSWWWVPLSIYDGASFFKGTLMGEFFKTSWPLISFAFLGMALMANSTCEKETISLGNVATFSKETQNVAPNSKLRRKYRSFS